MSKGTKGFAVGTAVAINGDLTWLYGAAANVLAEVVDVRLAGGEYLYTLACLVSGKRLAEDVSADDLHPVRC